MRERRALVLVALLVACAPPLALWAQQPSVREKAWADSVYARILAHDDMPVKTGLVLADSMGRIYGRAGAHCRAQESRVFLAKYLDSWGRPDSALQVLLATRDALARCGDRSMVHWYNNLSAVYITLGRFAETDSMTAAAIARLRIREPAVRELGLNRGIAQANLGGMDAAMASFADVHAYGVEAQRADLAESALLNMGTLHAMQGRLDAADSSYQAVLRSARASGNTRNATDALLNLAGIAEAGGEGRRALLILDTVVAIGRESKDLDLLATATLNRAQVTLGHGNKDSAFKYLQQHIALRDSILGLERVRAVADMEEKYESEKKVREITALRAANLEVELDRSRVRRTRNLYLFIGMGVLGAALALWGRLRIVHRSRAAIRKEKEISEGLLHNILPEEVADELRAKGYADVREFDTATILFTDFKGFTQLTEKLSAAELVAEIDHCFKSFDGIMERYRIEKIKTIGDAYMAAGGLPDPAHGSPAEVVRAALEMQAFMAAYKAERTAQGRLFFEMRVGIHTGPVIAGIVGVKKFAYDIWGDTVNTASRMESSGAVGEVNISEATYALVQDEPGLTFTPRGKVQAKGKGEMAMYFVSTTS